MHISSIREAPINRRGGQTSYLSLQEAVWLAATGVVMSIVTTSTKLMLSPIDRRMAKPS